MAKAAPELGDPKGDDLASDHQIQLAMCEKLEMLADGLPTLPPPAVVADIVTCLSDIAWPRSLFDESIGLCRQSLRAVTFARELAKEYQDTDASHARELAGELQLLAGRAVAPHPDELGFELRCLFESRRRAVAFERLALLTLKAAGEPARPIAAR